MTNEGVPVGTPSVFITINEQIQELTKAVRQR